MYRNRRKYAVISSPEQRQSYKNDFNAEYSEYRSLHARIEEITRQFTVLDNELKQLPHGTEKYTVRVTKTTNLVSPFDNLILIHRVSVFLNRQSTTRYFKSIVK